LQQLPVLADSLCQQVCVDVKGGVNPKSTMQTPPRRTAGCPVAAPRLETPSCTPAGREVWCTVSEGAGLPPAPTPPAFLPTRMWPASSQHKGPGDWLRGAFMAISAMVWGHLCPPGSGMSCGSGRVQVPIPADVI